MKWFWLFLAVFNFVAGLGNVIAYLCEGDPNSLIIGLACLVCAVFCYLFHRKENK